MASKITTELKNEQNLAVKSLTPEQRIQAFIAHCEQVTLLFLAGQSSRGLHNRLVGASKGRKQ